VGNEQAAAARRNSPRRRLDSNHHLPYTAAHADRATHSRHASSSGPISCMRSVERTAFVCDVGSSPKVLAMRYPHHEFAHLPHDVVRGHETLKRPSHRAELRPGCSWRRRKDALPRWSHSLAFILALDRGFRPNGKFSIMIERQHAGSIAWDFGDPASRRQPARAVACGLMRVCFIRCRAARVLSAYARTTAIERRRLTRRRKPQKLLWYLA